MSKGVASRRSAEDSLELMLVTNALEKSPSGGRQLLCKLNHDALRDIYGDRMALHELRQLPMQGGRSVGKAFRGHIDGLSDIAIAEVMQRLGAGNFHKVFVDGSNLGELTRVIKREFPEVEVYTFFHNVEARFFLGALWQARTPRALAVLLVNYLAERKAVRYSDKIICLSERDSKLLKKVYGRGASHVAPMAVQDTLPTDRAFSPGVPEGISALFVGGGFYANRAGIAWFVENVAQRIDIRITVVGRGVEDLKSRLERAGNVKVVGPVDSLAEWYRKAHFVIAPIFDGSGMKTKVAEALMHGKKVIGTPEAFSGYEDVAARAGWVCATADDFVAAIKCASAGISQSFDPEMRALYEEKYSYPVARSRLAAILG